MHRIGGAANSTDAVHTVRRRQLNTSHPERIECTVAIGATALTGIANVMYITDAAEEGEHCSDRAHIARELEETKGVIRMASPSNPVPERKKASDYPQELLDLFDSYVHGA